MNKKLFIYIFSIIILFLIIILYEKTFYKNNSKKVFINNFSKKVFIEEKDVQDPNEDDLYLLIVKHGFKMNKIICHPDLQLYSCEIFSEGAINFEELFSLHDEYLEVLHKTDPDADLSIYVISQMNKEVVLYIWDGSVLTTI